MSRYRFIEAQRENHPVRWLYQVLGVPASGYYVRWSNKNRQCEVLPSTAHARQQ